MKASWYIGLLACLCIPGCPQPAPREPSGESSSAIRRGGPPAPQARTLRSRTAGPYNANFEPESWITVTPGKLDFGGATDQMSAEVCNVGGWVCFVNVHPTVDWLSPDYSGVRIEAGQCVTLVFQVDRTGKLPGNFTTCLIVTPYRWPEPKWRSCLCGPLVESFPGCEPFDRDGDGDVDLADYALEQNGE